MIAMKVHLQICCSNTIGKQGIFSYIIKIRQGEYFRHTVFILFRKPHLILTNRILVKKIHIMGGKD